MDKPKALALIAQQRDRWPSEGSDEFIARRAQRAYYKMSVVFAVIAALEAGVAYLIRLRGVYLPAGGFLIGAAIFYWQSRRFATVLKVLRNSR